MTRYIGIRGIGVVAEHHLQEAKDLRAVALDRERRDLLRLTGRAQLGDLRLDIHRWTCFPAPEMPALGLRT